MNRVFEKSFFDSMSSVAKKRSRFRTNFNIHSGYSDPCQIFFNAIEMQSYIAPHRHLEDPKQELLVAVRGKLGFITFSDFGAVTDVQVLAPGSDLSTDCAAVEVQPGTWHTVVALEDGSVLLEVKAGPFLPDLAKEFAPWAPREGTKSAVRYLSSLKKDVLRFESRD